MLPTGASKQFSGINLTSPYDKPRLRNLGRFNFKAEFALPEHLETVCVLHFHCTNGVVLVMRIQLLLTFTKSGFFLGALEFRLCYLLA